MATTPRVSVPKLDIPALVGQFFSIVETTCLLEGSLICDRKNYGIRKDDRITVPAVLADGTEGTAVTTVENYFRSMWKESISRTYVPDFVTAVQQAEVAGTVMTSRRQGTVKKEIFGRKAGDKMFLGINIWTPECKAYVNRTKPAGTTDRPKFKAIW